MSHTYRDTKNAKMKKDRREGYEFKHYFQKRHCDNKGSGFRGCSCWHCQYGMHNSYQKDVVNKVRSNRRDVRQKLRMGNYDVPEKFSMPYTD